jgi:hypothetical protein
MWQEILGIIDLTTYVGFFVIPIGILILGVGMLKSPAFGKGYGGASIALGVIGFVAALLQIADPASMFGIGSYFAFIIFFLVLGWKLFSISRIQ